MSFDTRPDLDDVLSGNGLSGNRRTGLLIGLGAVALVLLVTGLLLALGPGRSALRRDEPDGLDLDDVDDAVHGADPGIGAS